MTRRGNPNWGKADVSVPVLPTAFEKQVKKLGLRPEEYQGSPELREWCVRNASSHYVPESLLKVWRIGVNANEGDMTS